MPEPIDPVVRLLLKSPLTPAQRRSASEAFSGAANEDDLQKKMVALNLPKNVRADLWDLKAQAPTQPSSATPTKNKQADSATWRFASNLGEMINPVAMATGLYQTVRHPIDTGAAILSQSSDQLAQAKQNYDQGRLVEAAGHLAGAIPVIGPLAAEAGTQIASGDVAGGLGKAAGMLMPFGVAEGLARGVRAGVPLRVAEALDRGANARVADVMSPKSSTVMGRRMGAKATKIAPQIEAKGLSRAGLQASVSEKLADATSALDEAVDARMPSTYVTQPVIDALQERLNRLKAKAVEAENIIPALEDVTTGSSVTPERPNYRTPSLTKPSFSDPIPVPPVQRFKVGSPLGKDVIPRPNAPRAGQIQQAIVEVKQLGPVASYDSIRTLREAYDKMAQTVYNPSVTADYLKVSGKASGAADVAGAIRGYLAKLDPETAAANLNYSLYKNASDILKATEEIERARPKVGRQIMARLTGTIMGGNAAGLQGAAVGYAFGPLVDSAINSGFTTKLQTAQLMRDLSKAIKSGDVGRVTSLSFKARQLMKQAEAVRSMGSVSPYERGVGDK